MASLADLKTPASQLILIHRGVIVFCKQVNLGNPVAIVMSGQTEQLQFDLSTLKVVENENLEEYLKVIRQETEFLTQEVFRHRNLLPKGTERSLRRLYGYNTL